MGLDHAGVNINLGLDSNPQEEAVEISTTLEKLERRKAGRTNPPTNQLAN